MGWNYGVVWRYLEKSNVGFEHKTNFHLSIGIKMVVTSNERPLW